MTELIPSNQGVAGGSGSGSAASGLIALVGLMVIGYLAFSMLSGSDRSEIRACIEAAQRVDVNGALRINYIVMLRELDGAEEVKIIRRLPNNVGLIDIQYIADRHQGRVICPA